MPNPAAVHKLERLAKMAAPAQLHYAPLSPTVGKTVHQVAQQLGTSDAYAEEMLSLLIDEGVAVRSAGDRAHSLYTQL